MTQIPSNQQAIVSPMAKASMILRLLKQVTRRVEGEL
jgi:hypothetical protein